MAAKSDASDGAAPNLPSAAPARAVVLTSLIQLVGVAMNLRLRHRRSLRAIERNLADSDPSLTKLFSAFTDRASARKGAGLRTSRPGRCARWRDGWLSMSEVICIDVRSTVHGAVGATCLYGPVMRDRVHAGQ